MLEQYDYLFPKSLIARAPASPRDYAKLLIYSNTKNKITDDKFINLNKYLPKNSVIVFNQTKVLPARFTAKKVTGGKAELLVLKVKNNTIEVLSSKKLKVNEFLTITPRQQFKVINKIEKIYQLQTNLSDKKFKSLLRKIGRAPLPPYIKKSPLTIKEAKNEYQTIFAKDEGSSAAPTASLHFTKRLLNKLRKSEIQIEFITLHVGLGTFAPITEQQLKTKQLHKEYYEIDRPTLLRLNKAKKEGKTIIAVGTTVVRTLESASNFKGQLVKNKGATDLFIQPGYKFKFINGLITNFHVPKSSLMLLVASLISIEILLCLYRHAIKKRYRLFSFGDGMLILPKTYE